MATPALIEAAKNGDRDTVARLLRDGWGSDERDEHGWTPLNWAAGQGHAQIVALLLEHGADLTATGPDSRTPRMIARAAGHRDVVALLAAAEHQHGVVQDLHDQVTYCQAYPLGDLRRFPEWSESSPSGDADTSGDGAGAGQRSDADIVYLHQDLTVTRSMWHGEDVIFDRITPAWKAYCETTLRFALPEDLV